MSPQRASAERAIGYLVAVPTEHVALRMLMGFAVGAQENALRRHYERVIRLATGGLRRRFGCGGS